MEATHSRGNGEALNCDYRWDRLEWYSSHVLATMRPFPSVSWKPAGHSPRELCSPGQWPDSSENEPLRPSNKALPLQPCKMDLGPLLGPESLEGFLASKTHRPRTSSKSYRSRDNNCQLLWPVQLAAVCSLLRLRRQQTREMGAPLTTPGGGLPSFDSLVGPPASGAGSAEAVGRFCSYLVREAATHRGQADGGD